MCTTIAGDTPMTFVSGIESVTVTNGGSGYYTDMPAAVVVPPLGSSASGAVVTVSRTGGVITAINVTTPGTGYQPIPATLTAHSMPDGGAGAVLEPFVNAAGEIIGVNIINAGSGYTLDDTVTATRAVAPNSAYVDAVFRITTIYEGSIVAVAIINPGSGYQPSVASINIVSTLNTAVVYPLGVGFLSTVLTNNSGNLTGVVILNNGQGYINNPPYLVISDPGTGATTTVTLTGTAVSGIAVNTPGVNYTSGATGTVFNPATASNPNPPASPAVVDITVNENTYGTTPSLYWSTWAGTTTNKPIQLQLNSVLSYFKGLGYTIVIQSNPATGNTIQWRVCW